MGGGGGQLKNHPLFGPFLDTETEWKIGTKMGRLKMDNVDMGRVECRVVWAAGRLRDGASLGNEMMTQGRPVPAQTSTVHTAQYTLHTTQASTAHTCTGYSTAQMDSRSNGQAGNHDHTHLYRYHQHNSLLGWNYLETSLFWSKCMRLYQHSLPGSSYSIFLLLSWLSWSKSIIVFYDLSWFFMLCQSHSEHSRVCYGILSL